MGVGAGTGSQTRRSAGTSYEQRLASCNPCGIGRTQIQPSPQFPSLRPASRFFPRIPIPSAEDWDDSGARSNVIKGTREDVSQRPQGLVAKPVEFQSVRRRRTGAGHCRALRASAYFSHHQAVCHRTLGKALSASGMSMPPIVVPRLIRHRDAPHYLGMDRNRFNAEVRPFLTQVPIGKQGIGFDRLELDAWFDDYKSRNGRPARKGAIPWDANEYPALSCGLASGTLISASAGGEFARALEQVKSRKRNDTSRD